MLVETSKPRTLLNDEDVGLVIKSKDVRMIYTLLQNTIAIVRRAKTVVQFVIVRLSIFVTVI